MSNAPVRFQRSAAAIREAGEKLEDQDVERAGEDLKDAAAETAEAAYRLADLETVVRTRDSLVPRLLEQVECLRAEVARLRDEVQRLLKERELACP